MMSKMRFVAFVAMMVGCSALQAAVPSEGIFPEVDHGDLYGFLTEVNYMTRQWEEIKLRYAKACNIEPSTYSGIRQSSVVLTQAHRDFQKYLAWLKGEADWRCVRADRLFGCLYKELFLATKDRRRFGEDGYAERERVFNEARTACDDRKKFIRLTCKQIRENIAQTR